MASYWTQRRKVQSKVSEHVAAIINRSSHLENNEQDTIDSETENLNSCTNENIQQHVDSNTLENQIHTDIVDVTLHGLNNRDDSSESDRDLALSNSCFHVVNDESVESDTSSDTDSENEEDELNNLLVSWVAKFNISHSALNELLSILHSHHPFLPKDARTLLKTAKHYDILNVAGGLYHHFGIELWVKSIIDRLNLSKDDIGEVSIQINIDGLPLFRSSSMQLWPILGRLTRPSFSKPFVIGLYSGSHKPTNVYEYTERLVSELENLFQNGILISVDEEIRTRFTVSCVICDAPAKAFVKQIKGHGGYHGCNNCTQRGEWHGKMTFPRTDAPLRTDVQFDEMQDEEHHLGPSPFQLLPIGMVSQFPNDFMHLVCLGVVKRMIWLWMKGPLVNSCRIGAVAIQRISDALVALKSHLPREFHRKGRSLDEVDRWKASEFRQFLLYTGPVVLKGVLSVRTYRHFMLLSVAIFCLSCKFFCDGYNQYADQLLGRFVQQFGEIYGRDMLVYNVHGLVHLANDVQKFGPLDNFSAFIFESFLGNLKRLVRRPTLPLQQVIRRISESKGNFFDPTVHLPSDESGTLKKMHENGIIPRNLREKVTCQYKEIIFHDHCFSVKRGDNCIMINDEFGIIKNVLSLSEDPGNVVVYQKFMTVSDFFACPLSSSELRIVKVSNLGDQLYVSSFTEISCKCVLLPYVDGFVCIPLVHNLN